LADKFNEHLYKLRIVTKAGAHHKLAFAGWLSLWIIIVAWGIYFGLVSVIAGDPFQQFWRGGQAVWGHTNYMPPIPQLN
jgi:hypothetical protein